MYLIGQIVLIGIIAYLFRKGGDGKNSYRDVGIPLILGLYYLLATCNFCTFLLVFVGASAMRLGYGAISDDDPTPSTLASILNDRKGWLTRGVWGFIVSFCIVSALIISKVEGNILHYIIYIFVNCSANYLLCRFNAKDYIHEPIAGAMIGSVIWSV